MLITRPYALGDGLILIGRLSWEPPGSSRRAGGKRPSSRRFGGLPKKSAGGRSVSQTDRWVHQISEDLRAGHGSNRALYRAIVNAYAYRKEEGWF